jgi:hypothetical protein
MSKDTTSLAKDFWGNTIAPGDTIAAPVMMQGFVTYARRKVLHIDDEGALVCTNMDGKPVNRVKNPKKAFRQPGGTQ